VRYARNAVFLDVLEAVDATLSASGALLFGSVSGCVRVRSELSGTPHCVMALNDSLRGAPQPGAPPADEDLTPGAPSRYAEATRRAALASSFTFHRCVRLRSGDGDDERREVAFVPPDGEFELLRYRAPLDDATPPPLKLISSVLQHGRTRLEIVCLVRTQLPAGAKATAVRVRLPLPRAAAAVTLRCGGTARANKAKWLRAEDAVLWKLPELASGQEGTINVAVDLLPSVIATSSQAARWTAPPAQLAFTVAGQTATGLRVRQLRVTEKANYEVTKCARALHAQHRFALRLLTPSAFFQVGPLRALLRSIRGAPANLTRACKGETRDSSVDSIRLSRIVMRSALIAARLWRGRRRRLHFQKIAEGDLDLGRPLRRPASHRRADRRHIRRRHGRRGRSGARRRL
jgi:AP-2 complex subunit mu-1